MAFFRHREEDRGGQQEMSPALGAALLGADPMARPEQLHNIGPEDVARAAKLLSDYKKGKQSLEQRIVEDELWWELRHWEVIRSKKREEGRGPEPSSAWLFNAIINKHADAMDNYPEPVVLPREQSDEESARTLSSVLPVVLESNDYEQTYSEAWWEKLKHGTAAYGVFWNNRKENGLGDVDIRQIDLLKLFWEPGVTDIQKSRNLFLVELVDTEVLEKQYPEHKGKLGGSVIDVKQYVYDDTVDTSGKSLVVDWYYKVQSPAGKTVLHYAKFVGDTLLFASENEGQYRDRGWYDHGLYPVVLDSMFPEKGTPVGFGYVSICKDPQLYIDKLSANILESSLMGTKKRFFLSESANINAEEFSDWTKPFVHVAGAIDENHLKEIVTRPLDGVYFNVLQAKIEELKDTAANRDVNSGGTGSGVTAAAAIAALQEAGNKVSRDMIAASYRAHVKVISMCIELIRQFYDESRSFRVTGADPGNYRFVEFSNAKLQEAPVGEDSGGERLYRKPIFDLKIKAQKKDPFSRMEQNERAKELYGLGFFNPERAQEALGALEMMEFEGKEKVAEQVRQGQTLLNTCKQMSEQMEKMIEAWRVGQGAAVDRSEAERRAAGRPRDQADRLGLSGSPFRANSSPEGETEGRCPPVAGVHRTTEGEAESGATVLTGSERDSPGSGLAAGIVAAHTPQASYGQSLAKRSAPRLEG